MDTHTHLHTHTHSNTHICTHTHTQGHSQTHTLQVIGSRAGEALGFPRLMEQEAEAPEGCWFPVHLPFLQTHTLPTCTHHPPMGCPPPTPCRKNPQLHSDRAATQGFSSCSHFYPLLTDEEAEAQCQDRACQRRAEDERRWGVNPGSVHRLQDSGLPEPFSPGPSTPTLLCLHVHSLLSKSSGVQAMEAASTPFLPGSVDTPGPVRQ